MADTRKTVRMPVALADRLRRSSFRTKRPQNELILEAIEHWLTHPYRPSCPNAENAARYLDMIEARNREMAGQ